MTMALLVLFRLEIDSSVPKQFLQFPFLLVAMHRCDPSAKSPFLQQLDSPSLPFVLVQHRVISDTKTSPIVHKYVHRNSSAVA